MANLNTIPKIELPKLNNSECALFMRKCAQDVFLATPKNLGLPEDFLPALQENVAQMTAIIASSHASEETAILQELDTKRDELLVYLLSNIRTACKSPIVAQKTAANSLYLTTKPFIGSQRLPLSQETQHIYSLE